MAKTRASKSRKHNKYVYVYIETYMFSLEEI